MYIYIYILVYSLFVYSIHISIHLVFRALFLPFVTCILKLAMLPYIIEDNPSTSISLTIRNTLQMFYNIGVFKNCINQKNTPATESLFNRIAVHIPATLLKEIPANRLSCEFCATF